MVKWEAGPRPGSSAPVRVGNHAGCPRVLGFTGASRPRLLRRHAVEFAAQTVKLPAGEKLKTNNLQPATQAQLVYCIPFAGGRGHDLDLERVRRTLPNPLRRANLNEGHDT